MEMSSFMRAVTGRLGRMRVRGVGVRITTGGLRFRVSARAFSQSHFWDDERKNDANTNRKSIRGCELRKMRFGPRFMQAVTRRIGRMQVHSVRMRITISGIRIRISARAFSQIQGIVHFLTPESKLANPTPWLELNSLLISKMSKIHNRRKERVSSN